jgi:hypothetical protein
MELVCKVWKSHGGVDESRRTKPWWVRWSGYAKLLAMLMQHGMFLVSCWAYPHRRLGKTAPTVRQHALRLASALHGLLCLPTASTTIKRCLAAGCRMNRRQKQPDTYQLLLDAT